MSERGDASKAHRKLFSLNGSNHKQKFRNI